MSRPEAPISVIIPCRNAERWLGEAIDSVLAQTVRPAEVLVVNDRSTDRSAAIASSFGSPVRVVPSRGRGCNAARYTGVLESRGEFIAFVDADDLIEPSKLERQLAALESADPFTIVHTGSVTFRTGGTAPARLRAGTELATGRCTRVIFERNPICGASVMCRRSTVLALGNYDPDVVMSGDYHFSLIASTRCAFICLPEPLYRIRRHADNSTNLRCRKTFYHWLAQEKFRMACPEAFNALPPESIEQFMRQPVLRAVRAAYWTRDGRDYRRLLALAATLAPDDAFIRSLRRRRWVPMAMLRAWDRLTEQRGKVAGEVRG